MKDFVLNDDDIPCQCECELEAEQVNKITQL